MRLLRTLPALFLEVLDGVRPRRCRHDSLRRTSLADASRRDSDWQIARFHALGGTTRTGCARRGRARRGLALLRRPTAVALVGPRRGRLARAQGWGPPLLDRPRIAADRGEISGHGRGFPRAGGIMFPQEGRAGRPDFPRTAVAGVAGVGEDLRGGLAGIEVCLGPRRMRRRQGGGGDDPRHDQSNPRHDEPPSRPTLRLLFASNFWPKEDATWRARWPLFHPLTSCNSSRCRSRETLF